MDLLASLKPQYRSRLKAFFHELKKARFRLLMSDYDGTLAPFHVDRMAASPYPGIRKLMERLQKRRCCRLVIISGRPAMEVLELLGIQPPPEIWGSHGAERFTENEGLREGHVPTPQREALHEGLRAVNKLCLTGRVEEKTGCIAVHWRGMPEERIRQIRRWVLEAWDPLVRKADLQIRPFDGGLELRVSAYNKGEVVKALLSEVEVEASAVYLGDDLTDEDAFMAIKGHGLPVLVGERRQKTNAEVILRPPGEVLGFFNCYLRACSDTRGQQHRRSEAP
jgi:trehalose-phosphatase